MTYRTTHRLTKFERFLLDHDACVEAINFVCAFKGSFTRAWNRNTNQAWVRWLALRLHGLQHTTGLLVNCPACQYKRLRGYAGMQEDVVAEAIKRGWYKPSRKGARRR